VFGYNGMWTSFLKEVPFHKYKYKLLTVLASNEIFPHLYYSVDISGVLNSMLLMSVPKLISKSIYNIQ